MDLAGVLDTMEPPAGVTAEPSDILVNLGEHPALARKLSKALGSDQAGGSSDPQLKLVAELCHSHYQDSPLADVRLAVVGVKVSEVEHLMIV